MGIYFLPLSINVYDNVEKIILRIYLKNNFYLFSSSMILLSLRNKKKGAEKANAIKKVPR